MVQALDAERFHLAPPLNQIRVGGHSAEDKWFLPLLHLLNAGSRYRFSRSASNAGRFFRDRALRMILPRSTASCWLCGTPASLEGVRSSTVHGSLLCTCASIANIFVGPCITIRTPAWFYP